MKTSPLALVVLGIIIVAAFAIPSVLAEGERAVPADNLSIPVLIQGATGTGSGFFLHSATSEYLVTAKHVLFVGEHLRHKQVELTSYPFDPNQPGRDRFFLDLLTVAKSGGVIAHPREDVAVVRLGKQIAAPAARRRTIEHADGVVMVERSASTTGSVAANEVKTYDHVLIGNDVIVFGYPTSIGLKEIPQVDSQRFLLRRGIVAGLNPARRSIIIDCFVYPGNSGGPVIQITREFKAEEGYLKYVVGYKVIGVMGEFVPFRDMKTNSGYAVATPMDFVLELVK